MLALSESRRDKSGFALIAIGVFKLVKGILLGALGTALVHWRHQDLGELASQWINQLWIAQPYFDSIVSKLSSINQRTLEEVAAGSFLCSALFLVEGIGLCRRKRWAEFVTVGITALVLPLEFYELFHHPRAPALIITMLNIGIVWYLIARLMHDRKAEILP